jgi:very-short-patch-repair endonuclease
VRLHRVCRIDPEEVCLMHGMRLTVPARTLLDLASCIGGRNLERALAHAERRQIVTRDAIEAMLARHHGRRGAPLLSTILRAAGGPALTRSEAEARFLDLVRRGALPRPAANVMVEGVEVDFIWRDRRLVAEIDGFAYHTGRAAFERDRRRDGVLAAAGYRVIRVTWRQLTTAPEEVLVLVARALFDPRSPETQPR